MLHTPTRTRNATRERLLRQWESLCTELLHPVVELDVETFAPLLSTYKLLRGAGHEFDLATIALMTCLERQVHATEDGTEDGTDSDEDVDAADYEDDDPLAGAARCLEELPPEVRR